MQLKADRNPQGQLKSLMLKLDVRAIYNKIIIIIEVKTWTRPLLATQRFMQINVLDHLNQLVTSITMTITCKHFLILHPLSVLRA